MASLVFLLLQILPRLHKSFMAYHEMNLRAVSLFILIWSFLGEIVLSQPEAGFVIRNYSVSDGLLDFTINAGLYDSGGFIWFGTQRGIVRFDGRKFHPIYYSDGEGHSLFVNSFYFDENGLIWVATRQGIYSLGVDDDFVQPVSFVAGPSVGNVNKILVLDKDEVWFGTEFGILRYQYWNTESGISLSYLGALAEGLHILEIVNSEEGVWIGSRNGLRLYPKGESGFINFPQFDNVITRKIYVDVQGEIWVGTDRKGVFVRNVLSGNYHYDGDEFRELDGYRGYVIKDFLLDSRGFFWIATMGNGLIMLDENREIIHQFRNDFRNPDTISNNIVHQIFEGDDGRIWVCTWSGLNEFIVEQKAIVNYGYNGSDGKVLNHNLVMPIRFNEVDNGIWIATQGGGINYFNRNTGNYSYLFANSLPEYGQKNELIWGLETDKKNRVWIATQGSGLIEYNYKLKTTRQFLHEEGNHYSLVSPTNRLYSVMLHSDSSLWVGSQDAGLSRMDLKTSLFKNFVYSPDEAGSISHNQVNPVFEDASGNVWVGTYGGGLNKYLRETDTFRHFRFEEGNPNSLSSNMISAIHEYPVGILWIGTTDAGLNRLEIESGFVTRYNINSGLPNNAIAGILSDEEGHLWISTQKGITRFDPKLKTFKNYDTRDGLQSDIFHIGSAYKSDSGEMFFGGNNGFNSFWPKYLNQVDSIPPNLVLTNLTVNDTTVFPSPEAPIQKAIGYADEINLTQEQNNFSIEFAALHFKRPWRHEYEYMLEGEDPDWRVPDENRRATYQNLPKGEYLFKVRAANSDGFWTPEPTTITVNIAPHWYDTIWAWMVWITLAGLGIFGFVRWRVRAVEQRAEQLEVTVQERTAEIAEQNEQLALQAHQLKEMDRIRSNFFANISHEFRTPLTTIIGPVQDTLNGAHGPLKDRVRNLLQIVERSGETLKGLIDQLLALAKLEAGEMLVHPRQVDLVAYVQHRMQEFELPASRKSIALSFEHDGSASTLFLDTDKLKYIFNNLLSNAIKFTPADGHIRVGVTRNPSTNQVLLTVADTGEGIPAEVLPHIFKRFRQGDASSTRLHEGTGIGLALTRELVELHEGTIEVESEVGVGSTFAVAFKSGHGHFAAESVLPGSWMPDPLDGQVQREEEEAFPVFEEPLPADAPRVLLVEDQEDVRAYIRSLLEGRYHVFEAENGRLGLEKALEVLPDLIVSDVMMPEVDGIEMVTAVKAEPALAETRVMMVTARADMDDIHAGLRTGADAYIVKPFNATEFQIRVENLIEVRKAIAANRVQLGPNTVEVDSKDAAFIKQVRDLIEGRMKEIKVSDIAAEMGVSARHLSRRIQAIAGLTARGYLQMMRLERAAQLLEQQHDQIAQIAYKVGYNDPNHFARVFRQAYDVTPTAYMEGERGGR